MPSPPVVRPISRPPRAGVDLPAHRRADETPAARDAALMAVAARQHGAIGGAQLRELGLGATAIARRVDGGLLRRVHRGVYLVGPVEAPLGAVAAALLACGPRAVASHRTAAWLWASAIARRSST